MSLNWKGIARATLPEHQLSILLYLAEEGEHSASDYAEARGIPLSTASYHFRQLRKRGWITCIRTAKRRGTMESYYKPTNAVLEEAA